MSFFTSLCAERSFVSRMFVAMTHVADLQRLSLPSFTPFNAAHILYRVLYVPLIVLQARCGWMRLTQIFSEL